MRVNTQLNRFLSPQNQTKKTEGYINPWIRSMQNEVENQNYNIDLLCMNCQEMINVRAIDKHSMICDKVNEKVFPLENKLSKEQIDHRLSRLRLALDNYIKSNKSGKLLKESDKMTGEQIIVFIDKAQSLSQQPNTHQLFLIKKLIQEIQEYLKIFEGAPALLLYLERIKYLTKEKFERLRETNNQTANNRQEKSTVIEDQANLSKNPVNDGFYSPSVQLKVTENLFQSHYNMSKTNQKELIVSSKESHSQHKINNYQNILNMNRSNKDPFSIKKSTKTKLNLTFSNNFGDYSQPPQSQASSQASHTSHTDRYAVEQNNVFASSNGGNKNIKDKKQAAVLNEISKRISSKKPTDGDHNDLRHTSDLGSPQRLNINRSYINFEKIPKFHTENQGLLNDQREKAFEKSPNLEYDQQNHYYAQASPAESQEVIDIEREYESPKKNLQTQKSLEISFMNLQTEMTDSKHKKKKLEILIDSPLEFSFKDQMRNSSTSMTTMERPDAEINNKTLRVRPHIMESVESKVATVSHTSKSSQSQDTGSNVDGIIKDFKSNEEDDFESLLRKTETHTDKTESPKQQRMFYSKCLAIKMKMKSNSLSQNIPVSLLYQKDAIEKKIPTDRWSAFIEEAFMSPEKYIDIQRYQKKSYHRFQNGSDENRKKNGLKNNNHQIGGMEIIYE